MRERGAREQERRASECDRLGNSYSRAISCRINAQNSNKQQDTKCEQRMSVLRESTHRKNREQTEAGKRSSAAAAPVHRIPLLVAFDLVHQTSVVEPSFPSRIDLIRHFQRLLLAPLLAHMRHDGDQVRHAHRARLRRVKGVEGGKQVRLRVEIVVVVVVQAWREVAKVAREAAAQRRQRHGARHATGLARGGDGHARAEAQRGKTRVWVVLREVAQSHRGEESRGRGCGRGVAG